MPRSRADIELPAAFAPDAGRRCVRDRAGRRAGRTARARALHWPRERTRVRRRRAPGQGRGVSRRRRAAAARQHRSRPRAPRARCCSKPARGAWSCSAISCMRAAGRVSALDAAFATWRAHARRHRGRPRARQPRRPRRRPAADWGVTSSRSRIRWRRSSPATSRSRRRSGYALCGHVHPGVTAARRGRAVGAAALLRARPPARDPAGVRRLHRTARAAPLAGDRLVAIAGTRLFALPPS